jgi:hypothetical protein
MGGKSFAAMTFQPQRREYARRRQQTPIRVNQRLS